MNEAASAPSTDRFDAPGFPFPRHRALWNRCEGFYRGRDLAHDAHHVLRVYRWSLALSEEAGADPELTGAAALVHDLDATPKNSRDRRLSSMRSAAIARPLLQDSGFTVAEIQAITNAVDGASWSRSHESDCGPVPASSPITLALQEADRLDAIGAIGIARCFATHQAMAGVESRLFDPTDPCGDTDRALDDSRTAVDHFMRKLLRIVGTLTLPSARDEGLRRDAALRAYLDYLARETRTSLEPGQ
jgi:uncharacterized protein